MKFWKIQKFLEICVKKEIFGPLERKICVKKNPIAKLYSVILKILSEFLAPSFTATGTKYNEHKIFKLVKFVKFQIGYR